MFPPGIGILLAGADTTTISANTVSGNQLVGLGVISLCLGFALQGLGCDGLDIDPNSDHNRIARNIVEGNGTVSVPGPFEAFRGDLAWDGSGQGNCWKSNSFGTSVPPASQLPACH